MAFSVGVATSVGADALTATPKDGGRKVIQLDELVIEGTIQKPQAFYVLPRASLSFGPLGDRKSFLDKIVRATQKTPF